MREVTCLGLELAPSIVSELEEFLQQYKNILGCDQNPYFRLDAYFSEKMLSILEVNALFVDGWGTSLNFERAFNGRFSYDKLEALPSLFTCEDPEYLPELQLFVDELNIRRSTQARVLSLDEARQVKEPVYVYGTSFSGENFIPARGREYDNKRNLFVMAEQWEGKQVKIPRMYDVTTTAWDDVPAEVVLKFSDKQGEATKKARQSVLMGKPQGKAKFLRKAYAEGDLVAQEYVAPSSALGVNTQLILCASGNTPVAGYVQYSPKEIINDNSIQGPCNLY